MANRPETPIRHNSLAELVAYHVTTFECLFVSSESVKITHFTPQTVWATIEVYDCGETYGVRVDRKTGDVTYTH